MKALLTIPMLVAVIATGLVSFHLFYQAHYGASELLTVASFLSLITCIHILSDDNMPSKKKAIAL